MQITPAVILPHRRRDLPTCVMLKHEDWPGLAKISALRAASDKGERRISILVGNGGMFLPEELSRGADGAMTGFAYPEMMVDVWKAYAAGDVERAHDLFDAYLPLARYEQQPGLGSTSASTRWPSVAPSPREPCASLAPSSRIRTSQRSSASSPARPVASRRLDDGSRTYWKAGACDWALAVASAQP